MVYVYYHAKFAGSETGAGCSGYRALAQLSLRAGKRT